MGCEWIRDFHPCDGAETRRACVLQGGPLFSLNYLLNSVSVLVVFRRVKRLWNSCLEKPRPFESHSWQAATEIETIFEQLGVGIGSLFHIDVLYCLGGQRNRNV